MLEIVNVVASGDLGQEIDLANLSADLDVVYSKYSPQSFPGLQIRVEENGPLFTIFSSGSYVVMGAESQESVQKTWNSILEKLEKLGIGENPESPVVRNMIVTEELDREVNLSALSIGIGLENAEYEPEQSPFLYYRPSELEGLVSISSSGKVVVTGIDSLELAEELFQTTQEKVETMF